MRWQESWKYLQSSSHNYDAQECDTARASIMLMGRSWMHLRQYLRWSELCQKLAGSAAGHGELPQGVTWAGVMPSRVFLPDAPKTPAARSSASSAVARPSRPPCSEALRLAGGRRRPATPSSHVA